MEKLNFKLSCIEGFATDLYGSGDLIINPSKYFICKYGELPNSFRLRRDLDVTKLRRRFKKIGIKDENYIVKYEVSSENNPRKVKETASNYLIYYKENILIDISNSIGFIIYRKGTPFKEIQDLASIIDKCVYKEIPKDIFYMLVNSSIMPYGLDLEPFSINKKGVDINANYNDDFIDVHETIFRFLKTKNENGIVLLHGKYGTGKTSYLRHLINKANEKVIFMPFDMVGRISDPYFLPFIKEHKDSILIIEDCDDLLCSRENGKFTNQGLSTLLNMGDGLLGDALNIKVICTFNTDLKNIDNAILRKGRLIARYEFNELQTHKAQQLSDQLGNSINIEKPMTLSEIYGIKQQNFGKQENKLKIGFKAA